MRTRKRYTEAFKRRACHLVTDKGMSQRQAAKKMKMAAPLLGRWIKNAEATEEVKPKVTRNMRVPTLVSELRARILKLREEIIILEKALIILK